MLTTSFDAVADHPLLAYAVSALALWTTWAIASTATTWYRLRHIPGPFLASISTLWMVRVATSTRLGEIFEELGKEYGHLVRIGPKQILTDDPDFLRRTGAVRGAYDKSPWYLAFRWQPYCDNVFNMRDRVEHDRRRAQIAVAYNISGREVDLIEPSVDEQVLALVGLLRSKYAGIAGSAARAERLNFAEVSSYLAMDVASRATFGVEFGNLRTDSDATGFLGKLRAAWPVMVWVTELNFFLRLFFSKTYLKYFGAKAGDSTPIGALLEVVQPLVHERFTKSKTRTGHDMLDSWIQHGVTQEECEAEGLLALVAGSETAASVMRMTFLSLSSNPPVYQKLKAVIKETVKNNQVSNPISYDMAKNIPYLRAVVYEGMRMRPGVAGTFPKVVPPQGEMVQGKFIPGGTTIGMNIPSLFRRADIFGPDPDMFRPERWLEVTETKRVEMEREVEMMFGSGRWQCAGKPIAFMELHKTFFEVRPSAFVFNDLDFTMEKETMPRWTV